MSRILRIERFNLLSALIPTPCFVLKIDGGILDIPVTYVIDCNIIIELWLAPHSSGTTHYEVNHLVSNGSRCQRSDLRMVISRRNFNDICSDQIHAG